MNRPLFTDSYGSKGPWCSVIIKSNDPQGRFWVVLIIFFKWFKIALITYKFHITIKYFNSRENDIRNRIDKDEERIYIKKSRYVMYAFPVILIFTRVPCLIDWFIYTVLQVHNEALLYIEAICGASNGIFNSLIFLFIHRRFI